MYRSEWNANEGLIQRLVKIITFLARFVDANYPAAFYMTRKKILSGHQTHPLSTAAPTKFVLYSTASIDLRTDNPTLT
jgi:hypothetical protein